MSGVHLVGPARAHEQLLQTWAANGLRLVTHVKPERGDAAFLRGLMGPNGFIVGRFTDDASFRDSNIQDRIMADPKGEAAAMISVNLMGCHADGNTEISAFQIHNEPVFDRDPETRRWQFEQLCKFYEAAINIGTELGIGIALFAFSVGTPELEDWPRIYQVWRYALEQNAVLHTKHPAARSLGKQHLMTLHQYGPPGRTGAGSLFHDDLWYLRRFELQVRPNLPADLKTAPYAILESGPELAPGGWKVAYENDPETLANDWLEANQWVARNAPGCKGMAFFTLNQEGGFDSYDIKDTPAATALAARSYPAIPQTAPVLPAQPAPIPTPPPTKPTPPPAWDPMGPKVRVETPQGVVLMDIERDYLPGVVDAETFDSWGADGFEALKAQTVAARSFLRNRMAVRVRQGFDVTITTADQAWKANANEDARRAVRETEGEYVWHGGKIANAFFFSQADGRTRSYLEGAPLVGWPVKDVPYLQSVDAPGRDPNRTGFYGHGIGMSQFDAYRRAQRGWTYKQILQHFYTGATVGKSSDAPRVPMPGEGTNTVTRKEINRFKETVFQGPRGPYQPTWLVLHGAGDPSERGTVHTTADYLTRANEAGVSSHIVVGNEGGIDYVYRLVPFGYYSNCVGYSKLPNGATGLAANQQTVNIEGQQWGNKPMPEATRALLFEVAAETILDVWPDWTVDRVLHAPDKTGGVFFHWQIDTRGKVCPGPWFYKQDAMVRTIIAGVLAEMLGPNKPAGLDWDLIVEARFQAEEVLRRFEQMLAAPATHRVLLPEAHDKQALFVVPNLNSLETALNEGGIEEQERAEANAVQQARFEAEDVLRLIEQALGNMNADNLPLLRSAHDKQALFVVPNLYGLEKGTG